MVEHFLEMGYVFNYRLDDERELAGDAVAGENFRPSAGNLDEARVRAIRARQDKGGHGKTKFLGAEPHPITLDDADPLQAPNSFSDAGCREAYRLADLRKGIASTVLERAKD